MDEQHFTATAIVRLLENDWQHAEVLDFPERSVLTLDDAKLQEKLARHFRDLVNKATPVMIHQRRRGGEPVVDVVRIPLDPPAAGARDDGATPARDIAWRTPIEISFHVVVRPHGSFAWLGFVPTLGIEVIAPTEPELHERLPKEIRYALARTGAAVSLPQLIQLQRTQEVRLEPITTNVAIRTPKQVVEQDEEDEDKPEPVIHAVGLVLNDQTLEPAWEMDDHVARLAEALNAAHPRSVLLVGPSGVGKTALVREMVRRRIELDLGGMPFWSTSGSRLVAGMSGYGQWQERCLRLIREAAAAHAVLVLGNLAELMELGRSKHNAEGIATFFRPHLTRGAVLAICECTPEQFTLIERVDPHVLQPFHVLRIEAPPPEKTKRILTEVVAAERTSPSEPMPVSGEALTTVQRLHTRYATYSAMPGRAIRFVRNLVHDRRLAAGSGLPATQPAPAEPADVYATFARETGLPLFLLDESVPLDLDASKQWFSQRLIGQPQAVDAVGDLLATVKTTLARPGKPIGSLLLIGPTGVGKTELAKLLAEFFFSDRARLTRFDMSEYATADAVERLIGGGIVGGERGEGLLTAKVREQPFGVILLDEFEKAHPALFDLLLQVLGEGRLTDAAGRVADFSNAFVLMTSNLGAESFQRGGFGLAKASTQRDDGAEHFLESVRGFFRPEFFNRIDRVIPFAPLAKDHVVSIARRELELIRRRDGVLLRGVELRIDESTTLHLAEAGFDARYGARPLKRTIERELLVPLADAVNGYGDDVKLIADVAVRPAGGLKVHVHAAVGEGPAVANAASTTPIALLANQIITARRNVQRLRQSPGARALENELFALRALRDSIERRRTALRELKGRDPGKAAMRRLRIAPEEEQRILRLARIEPVAHAIAAFSVAVIGMEDRALEHIYDRAPVPAADEARLRRELLAANASWDALLRDLYALQFQKPDELTLVLYADRLDMMFTMAGAYRDAAMNAGGDATVYRMFKPHPGSDDDREWIERPDPFFRDCPADTTAIVVRLRAPQIAPRLENEGGLHLLAREKQAKARCLVEVTAESIEKIVLRQGLPLQEALALTPPRRTYHLDKSEAEDIALPERIAWSGKHWETVIEPAADARLRLELLKQVHEA